MAGWIGVNYPDAAWLLDRAGEHNCTELGCPETSGPEVRNGQVEVELLRSTTWPFRRGVRPCQLEGQLERRTSDVYLTPFGISDIQSPIQEICVEGRKGWRVGAIEHDGTQAD
jgi:hypothetical protein